MITTMLAALLVIIGTACGGNEANDATAISNSTNNPSGTTGQGSALLDKMTTALQDDPMNDALYFSRAELYYKKEMYDEAIRDISQAVTIDSTNVNYMHLLADIYLDYYQSRKALNTMRKAATLYPERIPTLLKLTEFLLILQQNKEAFRVLDQVLKLDPQNSEAYFMMGLNFRDLNDDARAINSFQTAVENDPDLTEAWMLLGDLFSKKDNPIALQYYDNAIRLDSTNLNFIFAKANYLHNQGDLEEAIGLYEKIFKKDPQNTLAYYNLGLLYMEMDSIQLAKERFDMALKMDPMHAMAYYYRGEAAEKQGDLEAAKKDFEQALVLQPDMLKASEGMARMK